MRERQDAIAAQSQELISDYNPFMRVAAAFVAAMVSIAVLAQEPSKPSNAPADKSSTATSCGGGHTVDEYLAEKNKLRKARNKNPLPGNTCIWGWCRQTPGGPPSEKLPTSHPPQEEPPSTTSSQAGESSSKPATGPICDPASAVDDVEVGDFYYGDKNYHAALNRYESALQSKPGDPGIFLRLGKTAEKLGDTDRAKREYQASIDAAPDGASAKEAKSALGRLTSKSAK
jgi:tetratricopeptide (TPR) repeat protein